MVNHINWSKNNQIIRGDALQTQGNPSGAPERPASGVASGLAPAGTNTAPVWADVATSVVASPLADGGSGDVITNTFAFEMPANTFYEVINILPGKTTITMTDI